MGDPRPGIRLPRGPAEELRRGALGGGVCTATGRARGEQLPRERLGRPSRKLVKLWRWIAVVSRGGRLPTDGCTSNRKGIEAS